uniref:Uncharacterized protein n=1 Tax=Timema shepardi TaxID=629360 RepID=A0A7R9FYC7_TIMSH|nr:unnamed protein product [Timema shepardi]
MLYKRKNGLFQKDTRMVSSRIIQIYLNNQVTSNGNTSLAKRSREIIKYIYNILIMALDKKLLNGKEKVVILFQDTLNRHLKKNDVIM